MDTRTVFVVMRRDHDAYEESYIHTPVAVFFDGQRAGLFLARKQTESLKRGSHEMYYFEEVEFDPEA